MSDAVSRSTLRDASGEFVIVPRITRPASPPPEIQGLEVTLATQCSLSQVGQLALLAQRWAAPVSVAVFVAPDAVSLALSLLSGLRVCYPDVRRYVDFHIVFPSHAPLPPSQRREVHDCRETEQLVEELKIRGSNYAEQKEYPINLLRNVARRYSGSEFTLVTDIDMLPSEGLRSAFLRFWVARRASLPEKLVFVLPVYEVSESVPEERVPRFKQQLLQLIERQEARPFYIEVCWKCQQPTGYAAWEESATSSLKDSPRTQDQLSVLHTVRWRDPWEPFYISRQDVPLYDERFKQYGFNRISQVCETHVAGYDFAVLDDAFLLHRGFKRSDSFHADKELDQQRNRILFRQFKSLLSSKYATTDGGGGGTRSCS